MTVMKKVGNGDPLVIPANTYNAFIDAAQDFRDRTKPRQKLTQQSQRGMTLLPGSGAGVVLVRNDTPWDCWRYDILGIQDSLYLPQTLDEPEGNFVDRIVFIGTLPDPQIHSTGSKFVILLEPIAVGGVGRAMLQGVCQTRMVHNDESHQFATIIPGYSPFMESAPIGNAQILWKEPGWPIGEVIWVIVRLGVPIITPNAMMACKVWQDGGSTDGDATNQCDRTYLAKTFDAYDEADGGTILGEELMPQKQRPYVGKLVTAPATGQGLIGTGFYLLDANYGETQFVLFDANETLAVEVCDDGN